MHKDNSFGNIACRPVNTSVGRVLVNDMFPNYMYVCSEKLIVTKRTGVKMRGRKKKRRRIQFRRGLEGGGHHTVGRKKR